MTTLENLQENGYIILKNVFTEQEIESFKNEVNLYLKNPNKKIFNESSKSFSIIDFIEREEFKTIANIIKNKAINDCLEEIFNGTNYRFCSHNDIGINRTVGWHKDKLNDEYDKFETVDIWSEEQGEKHEIVKVLIYLQENDGLKVVPKSHTDRNIDTNNSIELEHKIGDVIIFDQRITHRGCDKLTNKQRILISFGFGKNNIFTDNFEEGTIERQNNKNKTINNNNLIANEKIVNNNQIVNEKIVSNNKTIKNNKNILLLKLR